MRRTAQTLTAEAFAPFGDVIDAAAAEHFPINDGTCERFDDLCTIDVTDQEGRASLNLFRGTPRPLPLTIDMLERHPLGSQAFFPLGQQDFFVVVAPPGDLVDEMAIKIFHASGGRSVNYAKGTWHFPLISPSGGDFLVIDRAGSGENCDIIQLKDQFEIVE
jgi:ureidoglycolate lyase